MIDPISWQIAYPLGLAAESLVIGDRLSARASVMALLERSPSVSASSQVMREHYETEAYIVSRFNADLDTRLHPLWVADRALRYPNLTPPGLLQYSLNLFLEQMER